MLISKEIRWFFKDEESFNKLKKIFENKEVVGKSVVTFDSVKSRDDFYFPIKLPVIGVKIREGNAEIKMKQQSNESAVYGSNMEGKTEQWIKYSFKIYPDNPDMNFIIKDNSELIKTIKKRLLLKLDTKIGKLVDDELIIPEGCTAELTEVKLNNEVYRSFGMEAFSDSGNRDSNFNSMINFLNEDLKDLKVFTRENNYSYPEYLIKLHIS